MSNLLEVDIRKPAVAGAFYPDSPTELRSLIDSLLKTSKAGLLGEHPLGLVCPHAGYVFSGTVAASAYKQLLGRTYDVVVVISPSHEASFRGCSTLDSVAYETPLGVVDSAHEEAQRLVDICECVEVNWLGHRSEHAIEVQLPFLQTVLPEFRLLPVVMGEQSLSVASQLGKGLGKLACDKRILVIASSDLSHYRSYPEAVSIDAQTIESISRYDEKAFWQDVVSKRAEACGRGPIMAMMIAGKSMGGRQIIPLDYLNSGDTTEKSSCVVGYGAVALC